MNHDHFIHWLRRVYSTQERELVCDDVQQLLPRLVEAEVGGWQSDVTAEAIHAHLFQCGDCAALYQGLRHVVALEQGGGLPEPDDLLDAWPAEEAEPAAEPIPFLANLVAGD